MIQCAKWLAYSGDMAYEFTLRLNRWFNRARAHLGLSYWSLSVSLASAGVRRALALAYFLVWAWHEHRAAAQLLGKRPEDRFVVLFDEPETHLHPRWQRAILPSVLKAIDTLRGKVGRAPQMLVATHSPLVAASLEPYFDSSSDDLVERFFAGR